MAIEFEFYESPDPNGEGKKKYHARNVTRRNVTTEELCQDIQLGSSLTVGDVKAALSALSRELQRHLADGAQVHLEGIGYFQATLKTSQEIVPGKTRAKSVWFKSVKFRADKTVKENLKNIRTRRAKVKVHSNQLTDKQVDKRVEGYFAESALLTRMKLQKLCGFTRYAADKHIKRLITEGKIKNANTPKQPMYVQKKE